MSSIENGSFDILIADSNPVFRLGVRSLLSPDSLFHLILEVGNKTDLGKALSRVQIDVVILGIAKGKPYSDDLHWTSTSRFIRTEFPNSRILLLPKCTEIHSLEELMDTGASGYIPLSRVKEMLVPAIHQIANGKIYVEEPFGGIHGNGSNPNRPRGQKEGASSITKRELQILRLIYDEYTNPEIANLLGISRRTVDTHRKNLLRKLNVRNTAGMIRYALRNGYVEL